MAGAIAVSPKFYFPSSTGAPLANGTLTTYLAGTTTLEATYQDKDLATANGTTITLDARGECVLWLDDTKSYKFVLKNAAGVEQYTVDNVTGVLNLASLGFGAATLSGFVNAHSCADYTALRAYTGTAKSARVTGYLASAAPSGIAGDFTRDDSDVSSADNSGTIIVASNGVRWKRSFKGSVNVQWFGATGDGTTDDTSAIQAALAWIKTRGRGGKLIFPAGTYCISGTLPLDSSGLVVEGEGADEGRVTWGKWPTRIKWIGSATDNMLEIDSLLTGTVRGGTIRGLVIDAQDTSGVNPLYANPSSSHWRLQNVCFRNYGAVSARVYLGTSCYGWDIDDVEIFNSQNIGIHLEGLNHHTTFRRLRGAGTGVTAATSLVRVGESDRCSNINFIACDFEAQNTTYQVELLNCRAVSVQGGYSEVTSNGITAIFRLGVTATSTVEGFSMNGFYVQGNDPTYTFAQAINILNASGVDIGGGNHFRNITTAVINTNSTACPNSRFGAGNYIESVGGGTVKFANLASGWSFHDSGTTTPTIVGTGGSANTYTTQTCQWWVSDGRCFFDVDITLSALNSTGPLSIETSIPYSAAGSYDYACEVIGYSGLTLAAGSHLRARVDRSTNNISLREQVGTGGGDTTVLNTEASATLSLKVSGNFPISPGP